MRIDEIRLTMIRLIRCSYPATSMLDSVAAHALQKRFSCGFGYTALAGLLRRASGGGRRRIRSRRERRTSRRGPSA